jgi:Recombination endonuclease VII
MSVCSVCLETKPNEEFGQNSYGRGPLTFCRACQREKQKLYYYANKDNIRERIKERRNTPEGREKARSYTKQKRLNKLVKLAGRAPPATCEICWNPPERHRKRLSWDHNHTTGEFRGWICSRCNLILGQSRDNSGLLRKMADYLENNK